MLFLQRNCFSCPISTMVCYPMNLLGHNRALALFHSSPLYLGLNVNSQHSTSISFYSSSLLPWLTSLSVASSYASRKTIFKYTDKHQRSCQNDIPRLLPTLNSRLCQISCQKPIDLCHNDYPAFRSSYLREFLKYWIRKC